MTRTLTINEKRFCEENKINEFHFSGSHLDDLGRRDPCFLEGDDFLDGVPIVSQIDCIVISNHPRFANACIVIINAIRFCKSNAIANIYHSLDEIITDSMVIDGINFIKGLPENCKFLKADFFYITTLRCLYKQNYLNISRYEILNNFSKFLRFSITEKLEDNNNLTIHIRSGDIFRGNHAVHPGYGQPPLAFYKFVIIQKKWERITLVYEDENNPVIPSLINFLSLEKINYSILSSGLKDDLEILTSAKNLVIGRGTFIYPILCLSKNITDVYCFEQNDGKSWGVHNKINFITIIDKVGTYKDNIYTEWKNTEVQRQLMLHYPLENLSV